MPRQNEPSCAHCIALRWLLDFLSHPTEPKHFAGIGSRYPGWSDRPSGGQWSVWHDLDEGATVLAVNLEGMGDAGRWPIGRLIERERSSPMLPTLAAASSPTVEAWLGREVWNPSGQGKIRTDTFLDCAITAVSTEKWTAVEEARGSQNAMHDGRGTLKVHLKTKNTDRLCEVSPHVQFTVVLWGSQLPDLDGRRTAGLSARGNLEPLHEFVS